MAANAIRANGNDGGNTTGGDNDAWRRRGAGGSIVIVSPTVTGHQPHRERRKRRQPARSPTPRRKAWRRRWQRLHRGQRRRDPRRRASRTAASAARPSTSLTEFCGERRHGRVERSPDRDRADARSAQRAHLLLQLRAGQHRAGDAHRQRRRHATFAGGNQISFTDIDCARADRESLTARRTARSRCRATRGRLVHDRRRHERPDDRDDGHRRRAQHGDARPAVQAGRELQRRGDAHDPPTIRAPPAPPRARRRRTPTSSTSPSPAPNDPPIVQNDTANAIPGIPDEHQRPANDSDPDGDTLNDAGHGRHEGDRRHQRGQDESTYTAAVGQTGTDTLTYTVSDGTVTAQATVTITIGGTDTDNDRPPPGCLRHDRHQQERRRPDDETASRTATSKTRTRTPTATASSTRSIRTATTTASSTAPRSATDCSNPATDVGEAPRSRTRIRRDKDRSAERTPTAAARATAGGLQPRRQARPRRGQPHHRQRRR